MDLELESYASLEAQVTALSDDIAYCNHDIDDGIRAGLFSLGELRELPKLSEILAELDQAYPGLHPSRLVHEVIRRLIGEMVENLVVETEHRISSLEPQSVDDIRRAERPSVAFNSDFITQIREIRSFLFQRMYRHEHVMVIMDQAKEVVRGLFRQYFAHPESLSEEWRDQAMALEEPKRARLVADYIAGMTDRYALREYKNFFGIKVFEE
jgi:dGTPase